MTAEPAAPSGLADLVTEYGSRYQKAVEYIPASWERALSPTGVDLEVLRDDRWSRSADRVGRRWVSRQGLHALADATGVDDEEALRRAFLMVMVWGSGTSNNRSLRNTARALAATGATQQLRTAALRCRDGQLEEAYAGFRLPGVGRSFFTKWFAFAGRLDGRAWQPLILDDRVIATLNKTLGISLRALADDRRHAYRYAAYVHAVHAWSADLANGGLRCTAEHLEWIMFEHKGRGAGR